MKKHLVFIVNPKSGTDRAKMLQDAIDRALDQQVYTYEILRTKQPRHGIELARKAAANSAYAVIAVGGDGSVNDVISGIRGTDAVLGIVPGGSGNGIARAMGLPLKYEQAIEVINRGKTERVDVGHVNEWVFISNAGVGFDALISRKFETSTRRGLMGYTWLVMKHLWLYKEREWRITIDGQKIRERAFIVSVANGSQFGYNFRIAPDASYNDGLLDVIIIRKFPKLVGWGILVRALTGTITNSRYVKHYRARNINITHPALRLLQTDGDARACGNSIDFSVVPGEIAVLTP